MVVERAAQYEENPQEGAIRRALEGTAGIGTCEVGRYVIAIRLHHDDSPDLSHLEESPRRELEARRWFRRHGYGRHDSWLRARRQAQEDQRRLEDYGNGWCALGIVVQVTKKGDIVGYSACWGYESDYAEYLEEEVRGHVTEALAEARAAEPPLFHLV